jgi:DUF1680 family protein
VFAAGDVVELSFGMRPRVTHPDPRVDAIRGAVAIERGPEVYCVESVDLPGGDESLAHIEIDLDAGVEEAGDGRLTVALRARPDVDAAWPYAERFDASHDAEPFTATIAPYHSWAERGPSTMRVWIPSTRS